MKRNHFFLLLLTLSTYGSTFAQGVTLYGMSTWPDNIIYKVNTQTCEICPILNLNSTFISNNNYDLVVLPNGDILVLSAIGIYRFDPPSTTPIWSNSTTFAGAYLAPNGLVYLSSTSSSPCELYAFNPSNNTFSIVGPFPPGMVIYELYSYNGVLYAKGSQDQGGGIYNPVEVIVNTANPSNSTIHQTNPPYNGYNGGWANGGFSTEILSGLTQLCQANPEQNSFEFLCAINGVGFSGLTDLPPGVPELPCNCATNAGSVSTNPVNGCVNSGVFVPYNNDATLEAGDILRYILFTDLSDTLGSIILISSTPIINFNPATMQTGVTYYLATLAGNNVNGQVDLNDPCLDISNAVPLIWRPSPTVIFTLANPSVCAGACTDITANFTGTPPFFLTYTAPGVPPTQLVLTTHSATFAVCLPANANLGSGLIRAIDLGDAFCFCF